jgi:hypothetical protein
MSNNPTALIGVRLSGRSAKVLTCTASGLVNSAKTVQDQADQQTDPGVVADLSSVAILLTEFAHACVEAGKIALQRENQAKASKAGLN